MKSCDILEVKKALVQHVYYLRKYSIFGLVTISLVKKFSTNCFIDCFISILYTKIPTQLTTATNFLVYYILSKCDTTLLY